MHRCFFSGLILILLLSMKVHSQSAMYTKVVTAGTMGSAKSQSIISDLSGNLYITGTFQSTFHFGNDSVTLAGSENMFLAKYSLTSGFLWAVAPNASNRVQGLNIICDDEGSLYVTGYFLGDVDFGDGFSFTSSYLNTYIAKYDGSGNLIWAKQVTGDNNNPRCLTSDQSGNVFLAGQYDGTLTYDSLSISSYRTACFFLKIGRDGEAKWISHSAGSGTSFPKSTGIDPSGNLVVTGTFINQVSFGSYSLEGFGSSDIFLCKIDTSGNFTWVVQAGGTGDDESSSLVCGKDGSVFINGMYEDVAHFGTFTLDTGGGYYSFATYAVKADTSGNFLWAESIDVSCMSNNLMCIDTSDNIYFTSSFRGSAEVGPSILVSHGYGDVYVVKMDEDGQILWAKGDGSANPDEGTGITLLPSGDLAVTGIVSNEATFDSISVSGGTFIAMIRQHGDIVFDEINYHSSPELDAGDWVELRNTSVKPLDLSGWTFKDGNDNNTFVMNPSTVLDPGHFLVICQDTGKFMNMYPDVMNYTGPFGFDLASNGEKIRLYDQHGLQVAQVRYYPASPWPVQSDGTGRTIELRNFQSELSDGKKLVQRMPGRFTR